MSTAYILGAGASRHVKYPLASTMGSELFQWMLNHSTGRYGATAEILMGTFGEFPNIEDVITEIGVAIETLDPEVRDEQLMRSFLGNAKGKIAEAIREWFCQIRLNDASAYSVFAERGIQSGDFVLTFNYDDSLERQLKRVAKWDLSRGYGFPLGSSDDPSPVLVLKLHGSINWLASLFGGATKGFSAVGPNGSMGQHPVIHNADAEFLGYTNFSGETYPGGGAFPSLILPGRKKEFFYDTSLGVEWEEFWDSLWSQASEALRQCTKIVLAGYSLLPVDERACNLILKAPRKDTEVIIVSGEQSERIAADFTKAGFTNVSTKTDELFEQWVTEKAAAAA